MVTNIDRWTYEVENAFLPPHEIEALAAEGVGYDEAEALGEDELAEADDEAYAVEFVDEVEAEETLEASLGEWEDEEQPGEELVTFEELVSAETGSGTSLTSRLAGIAALAVGPTLRRGSRGPAVGALQRALGSLGHGLSVDDDFGPNTERAVRAFQTSAGIAADGIVGPTTKRALAQALANRGASPVPSQTPTTPPPPAPSPGPSGTQDWTRTSVEDRMRHVMSALVGRYRYPANGAAGIVGNLYSESGVLPNRVEGSRPQTPMRARDFGNQMVDFTPDEIMNRDSRSRRGPRLPGIGLAQWTSSGRRSGLFQHAYAGRQAGPDILFDMDAQIDYLVTELGRSYRRVDAIVRDPQVSVDRASDEVVYSFEVPGRVIRPDRRRLPRAHPQVQDVFRERRIQSQRAHRAHVTAP